VPDLYAVHKGRGAWIELKVARGRQVVVRPSQVAWHLAHAAAGGRSWFIVRSLDGRELRLYDGGRVRDLEAQGTAVPPAVITTRPFDWDTILRAVFGAWP
jgi:Holliday junction resolvase